LTVSAAYAGSAAPMGLLDYSFFVSLAKNPRRLQAILFEQLKLNASSNNR
jgi:hypothetical protein